MNITVFKPNFKYMDNKINYQIKYLIVAFCFSLSIFGCSKSDSQANANEAKITDRKWKCIEYKRNGIIDAAVIAQQPTFEFRADGKLYFSQINPSHKDTLNFKFLNAENIKVTWSKNSQIILNYKIDSISDTRFYFTVTTNENNNIDKYYTVIQ